MQISEEQSQSPKKYSASLGWKFAGGSLGALLGIGGIAGVWYFGTGHEMKGANDQVVFVGISLMLTLLGFYCATALLLSNILVLENEQLRIPGLLHDRVIRKKDISGYRTCVNQGIRVLQINTMTEGGKGRTASVSMLFETDAAFIKWFERIPDIDAVDLAASIQDVKIDQRLGLTEDERLDTISRARKFGLVLSVVAFGGLGLAMFYPRPYMLFFVTLAALPPVVLWLCWRYPSSFSIDDAGKVTIRADLTAILILPGAGLAIRAIGDVQLLDVTALVIPTLLALGLLMFLTTWIAPAYRQATKFSLLAALIVAYPASVIAIANSLFDDRPVVQYVLPVLDKRETSGKGASHYLTIAAWSPDIAVDEVLVSRRLYQHINVGQSVCLSLHPGAFGMAWYTVDSAASCR